MKIKQKESWSNFVYNILYPGFVGSMIYEILPQNKNDFTIEYFLSVFVLIKILITIFYSIDYLHLYGDIHKIFPKDENQTWRYISCDFLASMLFFVAFIFVKAEHCGFAIFPIALIPFCFLIYKSPIKKDMIFHLIYSIVNLLAFFVYLVNWKFEFGLNAPKFLLYQTIISMIVYVIYVFGYYEYFTKKDYIKLFEDKGKL